MRVTALVLRYEEPGWTEATLRCIERSTVPMDSAEVQRGGTGSMSKAFNDGMAHTNESEFVWMLTNVRFHQEQLGVLLAIMDKHPRCAAVHPRFQSDHAHISCAGALEESVLFVEWTAPLVRVAAWQDIGRLDERMPYWGMDLDWSRRAKLKGWELFVSRKHCLDHTYLRELSGHPVTNARKRERQKHDVATEKRLVEKWGRDWMKALWPDHPYAHTTGRAYL